MNVLTSCILFVAALAMANAWKVNINKKASLLAPAVALGLGLGATPVFAEKAPAAWNSNIKIETLKKGAGGDENKPKVGDLVEIRFKGSYKGTEFDNTYKTELPYVYRMGVGSILTGLDETVGNMHVGEQVAVTFGGDLAFGAKGRPSAPGKPRIPPNAEIDYEVTLERLPGVGDEFIADTEE